MTYGGWSFSRGVDVRPVPKKYGHMEDPEDEVIDPKIVQAEARKRAEERAAIWGRAAVSMLWTREGGPQRVSRPHPPEPPAGQKPQEKKSDEEDTPGFADMEFQDPPPPPPAVNLGAVDIPSGWPAPSGEWPSVPPPSSAPSPSGPQQGGSW